MIPKVADAIAALSRFEAEDPVVPEPDPVDDLFAGLAGRAAPDGPAEADLGLRRSSGSDLPRLSGVWRAKPIRRRR